VTGQPKVLIVEDDNAIQSLLVAALRNEPLEVDAANDGVDALRMTEVTEYAVIVLDLMMPRLNGFDFLDAFRRASPHARPAIVVITAFDETMIGRLPPSQVDAIVRKPFDVAQFVAMVREVALTRKGATNSDVRETAVEPPPDFRPPAEPIT